MILAALTATERNTMTAAQNHQNLIDSTIGVFTNTAMEQAVSLAMKNEGTDGSGDVIGPMWLASDEVGYHVLESANADWVTESYAETLADALGLPFHIV